MRLLKIPRLALICALCLSSAVYISVTLLLNFVTDTQTHDVVVAGTGGANLFLKNNENNGYRAEIPAGRQKERGDLQFDTSFHF